MSTTYNPTLHRYSLFTAASTVFLLVAGALVTSNDAGLAVPDWPTSYGSFFPPMVGGILYEHGHRMVATFVGLATIGLAILLWRREARPWMRTLGWIALALVIIQGLFGALTVKLLLPPPVSIIHASLAQAFFCVTVAIAVFTSAWWFRDVPSPDAAASPRLSSLSRWLAAVTFVQLVLGAAFRHNAFAIWPHLIGAAAVLALAIIVARVVRLRFASVQPLRGLSKWLNSVIGAQILLGGAAWWSRITTHDAPQPQPIAIWLTVAHTVLGAIVLASTVVFVLVCHRLFSSLMGAQTAAPARRGGADAPIEAS